MPDQINKWICSICRSEHSESKNAIDCEAACRGQREEEIYIAQKLMVFPETHKNDDRYKKHCVECGRKLLEREKYYDGHRNEAGAVIFKDEKQFFFLSGRYCSPCLRRKIEKITKAYLQVYN
jgi:hypothetical protein